MPKEFKTPENVRIAARAKSKLERAIRELQNAQREIGPNIGFQWNADLREVENRINFLLLEPAKTHLKALRKAARAVAPE